jgi:hypothetical protein
MSKRTRSSNYVTVTLHINKKLVNLKYENKFPQIVNDEELWFDSRSGDKPYDMFHAEDWNEKVSSYFNEGGLNEDVEFQLELMNESDYYTSFPPDDNDRTYEFDEVDYEDAFILKNDQTIVIDSFDEVTSLPACIIKVPIYKKK